MEIKINKEIRDYQESIFMGMSLRQFIFAVLAVGVAIGVYFGLRNVLGTETVSWLCVVAPRGRSQIARGMHFRIDNPPAV